VVINPDAVNALQKDAASKTILRRIVQGLLLGNLEMLGEVLGIPPGFRARVVIHVSEMWRVSATVPPGTPRESISLEAIDGLQPSQHPRRTEVVDVCLHTIAGSNFGMRPIQQFDGKRHAEFRPLDVSAEFGGALVGPIRATQED
jgi:hypothetical protein